MMTELPCFVSLERIKKIITRSLNTKQPCKLGVNNNCGIKELIRHIASSPLERMYISEKPNSNNLERVLKLAS